MKRIFIFCILCSVMGGMSAQNMRTVFAEMPDSILTLLTKNNRLDCIDFIENDREAKVRNKLDGYSVLQQLTDDYLSLQLTESTQIQLKLLQGTDSATRYIALVQTYAAPAKSSQITFYTTAWQPLPTAQFLKQPDVNLFWHQNDSVSQSQLAEWKKLADIPFVSYQFAADNTDLVMTMDPALAERELRKKMKGALSPVVYTWRQNRFEQK